MQYRTILRILGVLLMIFSFAMLPPIGIAYLYGDGAIVPFVSGFVATFLTGFVLWLPHQQARRELKTRDGFLVVVLFWTVLSTFASIPFAIATQPSVPLTDAFFEAVSGLTATGSTVLSGLDYLPHSILFYRQQLHFLGGMGIVVLAVALLPMLGIGGMQLYRAETPGPIKNTKLTPRLTETAKALWYIYVGLTAACMLSFWVAGLPWFEAVCESFSVVATGGFSLHDASFTYYNSTDLDIIAIIFMVMGGTNFALHYQLFRYGRISIYWKDLEFHTYIGILAVTTLIVGFTLYDFGIYPDFKTTMIKASFIVVSLATTTGLTNADFSEWPTFLPYLIMTVATIGGCAASTAGGIKVIRATLLRRQGAREIRQLIHPRAVIPVKLGEQTLSPEVIQSIWAFLAMFILLFAVIALLLVATGLDATTAFGASVAALANAGAAIGQVADGFSGISVTAKWVLIVAMIAGRLEIFSLLVLFSPAFWRD